MNRLYGKSLVPTMLAPDTGRHRGQLLCRLGDLVVTNRHLNVIGQTDPNFWLLQVYDYHQYNSVPVNVRQ